LLVIFGSGFYKKAKNLDTLFNYLLNNFDFPYGYLTPATGKGDFILNRQ
jgi:hypothetical protein